MNNIRGDRVVFNTLKIELVSMQATMPTKGTAGSAAWDLYAAEEAFVEAYQTAVVCTGLKVAIPNDFAGLIWPRSGMSTKQGISTTAGLIDPDYRGLLKVALVNRTDRDYPVAIGDRIAQLLIVRAPLMDIQQVSQLDDPNTRLGGFGSTGV